MTRPSAVVLGFAIAAFQAATASFAVADAAREGSSSGESEAAFPFITARDGKLYEGSEEFRFVSWNIPNLHCIEDAFEFLGDTPWRWPDAFETHDALESVRQMGGRVARTYVLSVRRPGGDMGDHVHVLGLGRFNERAFETLDLVLDTARRRGVRVIVPLVDNWKWWGGVREYERFRGKPAGSFWTDRELIEDFKRTIRFVVLRRNTLSGVRYRDDPALFGWETGNELDSPAAWTREIAAYLKSLDPNHVVIDGRALNGIPEASLTDPNVDVVTTHHYPNMGNNTAESIKDAIRVVGGRKAYFVGEFGFVATDEAQRMLDTVIDRGVSGALYWSLRSHRREGGFYWHHEPLSNDLFKAYHWPGFRAGREYREHVVLPMVRSAAYRIRGLREPPVPRPAAPRLLEPVDGRLLSWQGSAGAASYEVQRAPAAEGPWHTIAAGVSDAAVQYRPLFADVSAPVGRPLYFRVIARNASGVSPPSPPVGPVTADTELFVDECRDATALRVVGRHAFVSSDPRRAQEDIHRLRLWPGSSVEASPSGRLASVTVWAFSDDETDLAVASIDAEGGSRPLAVKHRRPDARDNDYGYVRPQLVHATGDGATPASVRLQWPADATVPVDLSRIEVRYHAAD